MECLQFRQLAYCTLPHLADKILLHPSEPILAAWSNTRLSVLQVVPETTIAWELVLDTEAESLAALSSCSIQDADWFGDNLVVAEFGSPIQMLNKETGKLVRELGAAGLSARSGYQAVLADHLSHQLFASKGKPEITEVYGGPELELQGTYSGGTSNLQLHPGGDLVGQILWNTLTPLVLSNRRPPFGVYTNAGVASPPTACFAFLADGEHVAFVSESGLLQVV
ncbi:hypothetical protein [Aeoliella sp.]|uniref:hypothetical protein n=1 Tax=Aeoliella sp. TaxID=2795800 RepID=UPI003CCC02D4